jgi:TetR/AcrR family transcriptional repressor of nem operon
MARSQAEKAQTRERILTEAASQIREAGLESVSVARLMNSVDLTHGGFYNHFESRADLLVQALERALLDGAARGQSMRYSGRPESFETFVKHYLSRGHRDARKEGCALAALASDVARADEQVRAVMQHRFEAFVDHLEDTMASSRAATRGNEPTRSSEPARSSDATRSSEPPRSNDHAQALTAACTLIGGLLMARVLTDTRQSDALLKTLRQQLGTG